MPECFLFFLHTGIALSSRVSVPCTFPYKRHYGVYDGLTPPPRPVSDALRSNYRYGRSVPRYTGSTYPMFVPRDVVLPGGPSNFQGFYGVLLAGPLLFVYLLVWCFERGCDFYPGERCPRVKGLFPGECLRMYVYFPLGL